LLLNIGKVSIDITIPHKLSFKEKATQVKATIAAFMLKHKKTLMVTTIIAGVTCIGYDHYIRLEWEHIEQECKPKVRESIVTSRKQRNLERNYIKQGEEERIKKRVERLPNKQSVIKGDYPKCSICLESQVNFVLTHCQHQFCALCIQKRADCNIEIERVIRSNYKLIHLALPNCAQSTCPICNDLLDLTKGLDPNLVGIYFEPLPASSQSS
jgi:hypothetical protein